jgi:hypothetical protein
MGGWVGGLFVFFFELFPPAVPVQGLQGKKIRKFEYGNI